MNKKLKKRLIQAVMHLLFITLSFVTLLPVLYILSVSFDAYNSVIQLDFNFIPKEWTFDHYIQLFTEEPLLLWMQNTLFLSISTVVLSLSIAIPAAFAFSRMEFKGRHVILRILIILNAFPAVLSMFALYKLLAPMSLANNKVGLILIYVGTMSIFGLWNLKGYFDTIPKEIEDAARIDGANEFQVIWRILLPLSKPAIIVTAVLVLIFVWNEYIYAITFLTGASNFTFAAGLYSLQAGEMSGSWPVFAAASLVVSLPILIIFLSVQKHMVSGLSAGGVKG